MTKTTSDDTLDAPVAPTVELVTVSHPEHGTDEVPLDAAIALEAQKTGWVRDDKAKIAQLKAEKAELEQRIADLEAAAKADEAENKGGRKTAAAKADEAENKSQED